MSYSAATQFFATRGYAVLDVNYRGSSGYGRDYMLALRGNWGVYDVEDCVSAAGFLAAQRLADAQRLAIMGGSAGGYTVLEALCRAPGVFRVGLCLYGVSNMFTLAADTHKFEARYLDSLLGPLPEAATVYRERSPIFHAELLRDPIAVFQGADDRVVPQAQSDSIVASLKARGVPHEYHVYAGEGHGWRKAETIEVFYASVDTFLRQYLLFA
jgi:dipeptidyl aminopeptidase/acylaminoacyl peptidase